MGANILISRLTLSIDSAEDIIELAIYIFSGFSNLLIIVFILSLKLISSKSVEALI